MAKIIQSTAPRARKPNLIACVGDSLTDGWSLNGLSGGVGILPTQQWPRQLQDSLDALSGYGTSGYRAGVSNYAKSGDTSTDCLGKIAQAYQFGVPKIGVIFIGVNDPGNSIVQATTQSNIEAIIQAFIDAGCPRCVVVSAQYLNYASAAPDNVGTSTEYATYASVRAAQAAAVTAKAAAAQAAGGDTVFANLYSTMAALITAGTYTQGQGELSWHIEDNNQHFNATGMGIVASTVLAAIQSKTGWIDALKV